MAKAGLKQISNDVERCLSLVRVYCLHTVLELFLSPFSHVFVCSVCGGKDARIIIPYNSVVKTGQ